MSRNTSNYSHTVIIRVHVRKLFNGGDALMRVRRLDRRSENYLTTYRRRYTLRSGLRRYSCIC